MRRQRRINEAKPILIAALDTFRRLQAKSWAQRTEAELRACGVSVPDAPNAPDALSELTPQQRQIVYLASNGLTNRQIGDRHFLSPRTVSSHLYRSYPKLGVAGRCYRHLYLATERQETAALIGHGVTPAPQGCAALPAAMGEDRHRAPTILVAPRLRRRVARPTP